MTIQLESSLHHLNPDDFGGLNDFLSTADKDERYTLMIACADYGTVPDNVSFPGTDRFLSFNTSPSVFRRPTTVNAITCSDR